MSRSGRAIQIIVCAVVFPLCSGAFVWADEADKTGPAAETDPTAPTDGANAPAGADSNTSPIAGDLSHKTDIELTELTAQWGLLSAGERRKLLAEVRGRMAANQQVRRLIGVRVQRQYGRVVRKPDGSVVVETRVVEMTPRRVVEGAPRGRVTFGIGFEQRSKSRPQHGEQLPGALSPMLQPQAPAVTVSQQQKLPTEP